MTLSLAARMVIVSPNWDKSRRTRCSSRLGSCKISTYNTENIFLPTVSVALYSVSGMARCSSSIVISFRSYSLTLSRSVASNVNLTVSGLVAAAVDTEGYYLEAGISPKVKSPVMMSSLAAHRSTRAKLSMSTPSDTARSHLYESNLKYFSVPSNIFTTRITHSSASRVTETRQTWAASMAWSLMPASLQSQVPCLQVESVWMVQERDRAE